MDDDAELKEHLLGQVRETHAQFTALMDLRLDEVGTRELDVYYGALSKLVGKLEERDKSLHEVAQETFAEIASIVMTELSR